MYNVVFYGYVVGCYEDEIGKVVFDLIVVDGNVFFFFLLEDEFVGSVVKCNCLKSLM